MIYFISTIAVLLAVSIAVFGFYLIERLSESNDDDLDIWDAK